jgi:D-alanyl-D-alanine carboxypeptidase (penicillin-binding protein 5/6)
MSPGNLASPVDLLTIGRLALDSPVVAEIAALPATHALGGRPIPSTDDMLGTLGIDGLKTGSTIEAGHTILFTTVVDGDRLIGVVLGAPSQRQRATDVTRLIGSARAATAK